MKIIFNETSNCMKIFKIDIFQAKTHENFKYLATNELHTIKKAENMHNKYLVR